ncbi:MAG: hypothetical protein H8E44_13380 [Planctomycetes bacterium]|nr:hypothetical protein [Planctomycetota bacterium]MBL7037503.1 hypothetical protein [Pirellulaceae bacterium]
MAKAKVTHMKLQHSESVVVQAAAQIYAAYISAGRVPEGEEAQWMKRSIREAIQIAHATDAAVISDEEIDTLEGQQALDSQGGQLFGE